MSPSGLGLRVKGQVHMLFLALLHFLFFLGSKDTQALIKSVESEIQRVTRPSLRAYVSLFIGPLVKEKNQKQKSLVKN